MPKKSLSKKSLAVTFISIILIILFAAALYLDYAREDFTSAIHDIPQNAMKWVNPKTANVFVLEKNRQTQYAANYLIHYFSPWEKDDIRYYPAPFEAIHRWKELKNLEESKIEDLMKDPGYGINHLKNDRAWVMKIKRNMDMSHFPNTVQKVISLDATSVRSLPTDEPSFGNWHTPGEGYPFDYLQNTMLGSNTPALVLQQTQDGAWSFIVMNNTEGWVKTNALAKVDENFIQQWKTGTYMTVQKNNVVVRDDQGLVRFTANIGKIFPRAFTPEINLDRYPILIAVADANQQAVIKIGYLDRKEAATWPLLPTSYNFAVIMNHMLGVKYGWGGMSGDSDCSFTTMNLFNAFGIWLPRDSSEQALTGESISLKNLSIEQKQKLISQKGVPFLTLLHLHHHITLYIGQKEGRVYTFQTLWGVPTVNLLGKSGRAIIGNTVIVPADLGHQYWNVKNTWIARMDKMILYR